MGGLQQRNFGSETYGIPDGWFYTETVANGMTSDPVKIHLSGKRPYNITLAIIAGSGTGKIQYTLDDDNAIDADTAVWFDWDKGEITGTETDVIIAPVSAIRGVSVSGVITFKLLI